MNCSKCGKVVTSGYMCDEEVAAGIMCGECFEKSPCSTEPHEEGCMTLVIEDE